MHLTNTRPTLLQLPSGANMGPGQKIEVTEEQAEALKKHPCTSLWLSAGFLRLSSDSGEPVKVEPTSDERLSSARVANVKAAKLSQIGAATSAEALSQLAAGETDPEVLKALNDRLNVLVAGATGGATS